MLREVKEWCEAKLASTLFKDVILAMFSRKRKHGYEDDDHVVKKPLVTEEVSDDVFASLGSFGANVHFPAASS